MESGLKGVEFLFLGEVHPILQRRNCRWSCGTDSRVRKKGHGAFSRSSEWSDDMSILCSWEMGCKLGTQFLFCGWTIRRKARKPVFRRFDCCPYGPVSQVRARRTTCSCSLIMAFPVWALSYLPMHITKFLQSTPAYWWMTRSPKNYAQAVPSFSNWFLWTDGHYHPWHLTFHKVGFD